MANGLITVREMLPVVPPGAGVMLPAVRTNVCDTEGPWSMTCVKPVKDVGDTVIYGSVVNPINVMSSISHAAAWSSVEVYLNPM